MFELAIQGLILASLVTFAWDTVPGISDTAKTFLTTFEVATVALFTIEYLLRVTVSRPWYRFTFSFFGLVDLLAILPFYLTAGLDLRSVRVLRVLRLFRVLKLLRYSKAIRRFRRAVAIAREELVLFFLSALLLLYLCGVGIYYLESDVQPHTFGSVFDGLWWAVATLSTVGYGDTYPMTVGGRVFTFAILMIGLGIVAVPSGLVASALAQARQELAEEDAEKAAASEAQPA